ncbi:MAG: gamma-glutamyl-gamma-aminobutyrate hydrolase family protein [Dermatophilaceae bacterium]
MARPVIGISCYVEKIDRTPWTQQWSAVLPHMYIDHVEAAGGAAVILPPRLDADEHLARDVLARVDGLIIAGGADVESVHYGAAPHPTSQSPRPDRDQWELALARVSHAVDLPVLGICRGMQVMAVAAGGVIEQHLPDRVGSEEHLPELGVYAVHPVSVVADTRLAGLLGAGEIDVPTYHHQGVEPASLARTGYTIAAWHADGTPEALEDSNAAFRLAVQWHPEAGADGRLFDGLVAAARH